MSRKVKKATAQEQLLRIQSAASAIVASANEGQSAERKVTARSLELVTRRSFARNASEPFSVRKYKALRDVSDFITMSQRGKSNYVAPLNTDLLPVCNPLSTKKNSMDLGALSAEKTRWVCADPLIEDSVERALVASLLVETPGTDYYNYLSSRISSIPRRGLSLSALIASYGGGNSRAARSARARAQRRDRKGRFAWMGGGMSTLVRRKNGVVNRLTGRWVAQGVGTDNTFDIETPDGKLYRVPATASEAVRGVIPSKDSPDGYSRIPAKEATAANTIDEADLVQIDAPQGFRKDKFWGGLGTRYTDDAYDVIKYEPGEPGSEDLVPDQDPSKPVYVVFRNGLEDTPINATQSWADTQAAIRADEPKLDDEEGRSVTPIARLTDAEFDALNDDPDFDPDTFVQEKLSEPSEEGGWKPSDTRKKIPYETLTFEEDGQGGGKAVKSEGESEIIDFAGRKIVIMDVDGQDVPFYLSTGKGGKEGVKEGEWYPFFGIDPEEGWINKTTEDEINDYYGSPELKATAEWLNENVGDVRNDESIPKVKATGSHVDFINESMDITPVQNGKPDTRELIDKNIEKVKERIGKKPSKDSDKKAELPAEQRPSELEEAPYSAVSDLEDFEYKVPKGAHDIDVSSDYEPEGRTTQESADYTDDPKILADYPETELKDALSQALLGDDPENPDGSGFGDLEFSEGLESVPAHALYEALYEAGIDPDMEVAKVYDSALGTTENQDSLTSARKEAASAGEPIADLGDVDEGVQLPPSIDGASEDEKNAYLESGDWTPFLQKNQEFEETGSYNLLDTDPYEPFTEEQRAEAELPDSVFDSPVDLANSLSEEDLTNYLRESVEPDSEMPGYATVSYEDEDGEITEAYIPGEAIRDALQLQGVDTNEVLAGIYEEAKADGGDQEPTDDEATDIIDQIDDQQGMEEAEVPEEAAELPSEAIDAENIDSSDAIEEEVDTEPVGLPTPTPENPAAVYVGTPGKLSPGDITFKDDPEREYFVVESVEKKGSKTVVRGYYPGHESQEKTWGSSTPITFLRGVKDVPASGDKPALNRPFAKDYGPVEKDENGNWLPKNPAEREAYLADKEDFEIAKAESGATFTPPFDVDAEQPIPLSAPSRPSMPALSGDRIKQLMEEAGGDPQKFSELLKKETVYFVDFETSAQSWDKPTPIQVAVYKYTNGELDGEPFVRFMNPGEELGAWYEDTRADDPSKLLKDSNGDPITNEFLAQQPSKDEVMAELYDYMGESPIVVAHNMAFDGLILQQQAEDLGKTFDSSGMIDTLTLARTVNPKMKNDLASVAGRFGIKDKDWHDASADAEALPAILDGLLGSMKPWHAEKVFDIDARDAEYKEKLAKYESDLDAYEKFAAERAVAEAWADAQAGETPNLDDMVKKATVEVDSPSSDEKSPSTDAAPSVGKTVTSVYGDKISSEWVEDDENTEDLGKVTGSEFQVGDFYGSSYGWSQVVDIQQDPDKENLLLVNLRSLKSGAEKTYRFKKDEANYSVRRRHSSDKLEQPSEAPEAGETAPVSKFDDEFGLDVDMSTWVKDGGQAGSNEGAFYTDPATGMRYYVKKPKSAKHARNEALASAFYNEAGVRHGRIYIAKDADGNEVLISPIVQGDIKELGDTDWQNDPEILKSAQNGFVMDAWLNNWDSVGMNYDNMIVKGKDVYRIDPGGALIFRAQGQDKSDTLTPEAQQIDDLRFKGKKASSVFGSMTDEEIAEDAKKLVGLSPERISELVDTAFADDPETGDFIKERLLARRQTIMDRFGLTEDDFPKGKQEEVVEEVVETEISTPEAADPGIDQNTGGYSPEMKSLVDLFVSNPTAAKEFLDKVKQDNPDLSPDLVDNLLKKIDKPEPEPKDVPEAIADDISSEIVDSEVVDLDTADPEFEDSGLEGLDDVDFGLDEVLDDDTLSSVDKVINKILETYEVVNNGDGTFTLNSTTRVGPGGGTEKLEVKIQKNKNNTFSVLFVQTKWDQDGNPTEKIVDKYAPRHSFKALSNNVARGQKLFDGFMSKEDMSTDTFVKLVSKNTYKKISGDGAIEAVKATHLSADGITELKPGDRVYNWKNGKWGTVDSIKTEYTGQGKHKVKELSSSGQETYSYTDYVKVRWDDNPTKAPVVVSNALFKIDPDTGYAVNTPSPVLYDSKGKPKPADKQPKKPETPDPKNGSPATAPPQEPEVKAPEPEQIEVSEVQAAEPDAAPSPETDPDAPEAVKEAIEEPAPEPADVAPVEYDEDDNPIPTDAEAAIIIDQLGASVGGVYSYHSGKDIEVVSIDKTGVTYKDVVSGEEGKTPLVYWNQEELDGVVGAPNEPPASNVDKRNIGDTWTYNASDGTATEMTLTQVVNAVTYSYTDKNGKLKSKSITESEFKNLAETGKITPGKSNQLSPAAIRSLKELADEDQGPATGDVFEGAKSTDKTVAEQNNDGSTPLIDFASVEDAVALVKERRASGYQHRVTYDGESISDLEVIISAPIVDGKNMTGAHFRLKGEAADALEKAIASGDADGWTSSNGVVVPYRKRVKSGLRINTKKTIGVPTLSNSGKTYTKTLPDGTQIRFYRDKSGAGFSFGNTVEIYSPNNNLGKEDLDALMSDLGVPEENQTYATKDTLRRLGQKRLLEYFYTGKSESGDYKKDPSLESADLDQIQKDWGVTADDLVVEQAPDGRMQLVFSDETAQKILDYTGIKGMYAHTGANSIATILGGANPGMQSINQRVFTGVFKYGGKQKTSAMSQSDDMFTGGAEFVYLRPIRGTNNPNSGSTRIFVDPLQIVKRLDIFAYPEDMWGVKNHADYRWNKYIGNYGGAGQPYMLKKAADNDKGAPEVMIRHNIPLTAILGYIFNYNSSREEAIKKLKEAGITHVNGIPIEEFLKTSNTLWHQVFDKAAK